LEVVSINPVLWPLTAKATVVAEIVLSLRFAHRFVLHHGHLTGNNILFDSDHCIQIVDFNPIVLEVGESENKSQKGLHLGGFSGEGWTPERDIQAFVSNLVEVMFGHRPQNKVSIPTAIPDFVSVSSNQPSLLDPEDVVHSILFWRF
jgi:hypothetical protein